MNDGLPDREKNILDLLASDGASSVSFLSEALGVSAVTIRADLKSLEDKGFLARSRGGASLSYHKSILDRQRERVEDKCRIAKAAAELVRDGDRIMIEAGTTTALILRYLGGKRDIHVVTNSTLALAYARQNPALDITVTGGEFRRSTESMVGPIALEAIARLNVRLAFVGTDGFSLDRGATTHIVEGAEIVKAMVARADMAVLVADSSKYGRAGFVSVLPLSGFDLVIMDKDLPEAAADELRAAQVDLTLV